MYGASGTGKTRFSATGPTPLLLIDVGNEHGERSVQGIKGIDSLRVTDWSEVEDAIEDLLQDHRYKTVVIDTVSNLQQLAYDRVEQEVGKTKSGRIRLSDWGTVNGMVKDAILDLKSGANCNLVFIAQERDFTPEDAEPEFDGEVIASVGPGLSPGSSNFLCASSDVIVNTFKREKRKKVRNAGGKVVTAVSVVYSLRIGAHVLYETKIRVAKGVQLPDFIDNPTYAALMKVMEGNYNGEKTRTRKKARN